MNDEMLPELFFSFFKFTAADSISYSLVYSSNGQIEDNVLFSDSIMYVFNTDDVIEIIQTPVISGCKIKANYNKITATLGCCDLSYFQVVKNLLHCTTGPAYYNVHSHSHNPTSGYYLHGKHMLLKTWLSWIKDTQDYPQALAHVLGDK